MNLPHWANFVRPFCFVYEIIMISIIINDFHRYFSCEWIFLAPLLFIIIIIIIIFPVVAPPTTALYQIFVSVHANRHSNVLLWLRVAVQMCRLRGEKLHFRPIHAKILFLILCRCRRSSGSGEGFVNKHTMDTNYKVVTNRTICGYQMSSHSFVVHMQSNRMVERGSGQPCCDRVRSMCSSAHY